MILLIAFWWVAASHGVLPLALLIAGTAEAFAEAWLILERSNITHD